MSNENKDNRVQPYSTMYWIDFLVIGGLVLLTIAGFLLPRLLK